MDHAHALDAHAAGAAHHETSTGLDNRKLAFWTFIGSECLLFGSLIGTYLAYKGKSLTGPYPHDTMVNGQLVKGVFQMPLITATTFVLLMSSVFMVFALHFVQKGDRANGTLWLLMTALGGAIFAGGQVYEYMHFYHEGMTLSANLFSSSFYLLTGFHGAHVTVGVIYLVSLAILNAQGKIPPEKSLNVELAGLYWHFVDVIWIVIFPLVYLIK